MSIAPSRTKAANGVTRTAAKWREKKSGDDVRCYGSKQSAWIDIENGGAVRGVNNPFAVTGSDTRNAPLKPLKHFGLFWGEGCNGLFLHFVHFDFSRAIWPAHAIP
jgi:hypothetical protein